MKHIFFSILIIHLTTFANGQDKQLKNTEVPTIEITGQAEKEIIPDRIYISIALREKYVNKTKVTIEEQEEKLKKAIKSLNIDLSDLSVSNANADYIKVNWKRKDVLTYKDYKLKVADAMTLGLVFQELEKIEIMDAYISEVNHSKIDSLKKEVRIQAIKNAKARADYLLNAIGEQTGKPILITESPDTYAQGTHFNRMATKNISTVRSSAGYVEQYDPDEIQFQKIKIDYSIFVKFSIK